MAPRVGVKDSRVVLRERTDNSLMMKSVITMVLTHGAVLYTGWKRDKLRDKTDKLTGVQQEYHVIQRECRARSVHTVRSFGCRQILGPYFWPILTSFRFHTGVVLASYAFGMWYI